MDQKRKVVALLTMARDSPWGALFKQELEASTAASGAAIDVQHTDTLGSPAVELQALEAALSAKAARDRDRRHQGHGALDDHPEWLAATLINPSPGKATAGVLASLFEGVPVLERVVLQTSVLRANERIRSWQRARRSA
jgi:hypothetical protein